MRNINRESVLKDKPDWSKYTSSGQVSANNIQLIYEFDGSTVADFISFLSSPEKREHVINYIQTVFRLFLVMKDIKSSRYLLTLLDDFIVSDAERLIYIFPDLKALPYYVLNQVLDDPTVDRYTISVATNLQGAFICSSEYPKQLKEERLLKCLKKFSPTSSLWNNHGTPRSDLFLCKCSIDTAEVTSIQESCLKEIYTAELLDTSLVAMDFNCNPTKLSYRISRYYELENQNMQTEYFILCILWQCSYTDNQKIYTYFKLTNVLKLICSKIKNYTREKCLRVALYILSNFLKFTSAIEDYIEYDLYKTLKVLLERTYTDSDVKQTCVNLKEEITKNYHVLSSYDRYLKEVESKALTWGPTHTPDFFKDNIQFFEKNSFEVLTKLKEIITESTDTTSLSIACFDIGEFTRFYPPGSAICKANGIKDVILKLLSHSSVDVAREALTACSKMTINSWTSLEINKV